MGLHKAHLVDNGGGDGAAKATQSDAVASPGTSRLNGIIPAELMEYIPASVFTVNEEGAKKKKKKKKRTPKAGPAAKAAPTSTPQRRAR